MPEPSREEMQRAHDMLNGLLHGEIEGYEDHFSVAVMEKLASCRDVLCWVLGHENQTFLHNLEAIEERANALGYYYDPDGDDDPLFGHNGNGVRA